jgi:hypothetical protein
MHTLSIFPSILTFSLVGPLIIRITASLYVFYLGKQRYKNELKWTSIFYFAAALCVFVGLFTQIAVLVAMCVVKFDFYLRFWKTRKTVPVSKETYFLYFLTQTILLSLLFTGPGFLAFDFPL